MGAHPGVHRDRGGGRRVDRPGRAELRDRERRVAGLPRRLGQPGPLLAEQEAHPARHLGGLEGQRAGQVVDAPQGDRPARLVAEVRRERRHVLVVDDVLVAVGDHRAAPVPAAVADDVDLAGEERVRGADDRADVEVVLPVLDRDVEVVPASVEVGDDRVHRPVAVAVDDVAAVAVGEQRRVVLLAGRPRALPRAEPDLGGPVRHRVVRRSLAVGLVDGAHPNAETSPGALCGRASARTSAVWPCRSTATMVSRPSTAATTSSGKSGVGRVDARRQVVGVDDHLHHPDQEEVRGGQCPALPRHQHGVRRSGGRRPRGRPEARRGRRPGGARGAPAAPAFACSLELSRISVFAGSSGRALCTQAGTPVVLGQGDGAPVRRVGREQPDRGADLGR